MKNSHIVNKLNSKNRLYWMIEDYKWFFVYASCLIVVAVVLKSIGV